MLGCRFKSAKLVYSAGAVDVPKIERAFGENDIVQLYYYRFDLLSGQISHAFPLAGIPFEFPTTPPGLGMSPSRYVYGCTMASGSFDERLGGAAKVDCIVKLDVLELIDRGKRRGEGKWDVPVDNRTAGEIIRDGREGGVISIFNCPEGWYAQEPRFVPRQNGKREDEGYLLSYGKLARPITTPELMTVYDERYLMPDGTPSTAKDAGSELWVIDAKTMHRGQASITCRIKLPQRVPYGYVPLFQLSTSTDQ
jgi:carotenoid cleavage dioxygenase-like enzyme